MTAIAPCVWVALDRNVGVTETGNAWSGATYTAVQWYSVHQTVRRVEARHAKSVNRFYIQTKKINNKNSGRLFMGDLKNIYHFVVHCLGLKQGSSYEKMQYFLPITLTLSLSCSVSKSLDKPINQSNLFSATFYSISTRHRLWRPWLVQRYEQIII